MITCHKERKFIIEKLSSHVKIEHLLLSLVLSCFQFRQRFASVPFSFSRYKARETQGDGKETHAIDVDVASEAVHVEY